MTSFFEGKSVLVTGADGFIGSHLAEHLAIKGARVKAFCFYNAFGSYGWLDNSPLKNELELVLGDIRDSSATEVSFKGIEIVFHLASLIGVPYSFTSFRSYVDTNILGTLNVLESALNNSVSKVVNTSTSEVYGNQASLPITPNNSLKANSPYAATKIAADKLSEAFVESFGLNVNILRPFNTFGPRQSKRALIPSIISQLLKDGKELKLGSITPKRDFTYVSDVIEGFDLVARCDLNPGTIIQLGSGTSYSVLEIADKVAEILDVTPKVVADQKRFRPITSEIDELRSNFDSATEIGWAPKVDLDEGLKKTILWWQEALINSKLSHLIGNKDYSL